jgi:hypothetical protein
MDLNTMSLEQLAEKYNEMVLTATDLGIPKFKVVKGFRDKSTAMKRCAELNAAIQSSKKPAPTAKTKTSKAAPAKTAKAKPAAKERKRAGSIPDSAKIFILVEENPKRAKAKERFALYKEGMLVGTYKEKVGDAALALACIRWDAKKGFIKVA